MGSTSFLGFSYPNLLIVFLNMLFFRNLYHIFLAASVSLSARASPLRVLGFVLAMKVWYRWDKNHAQSTDSNET